IAHDFNNLLLAVSGNLDMALLDLSAVSPARPGIEQAARAAKRATELTREMLAYSGRGKFEVKSFSLNELVRENAHLFHVVVSKNVTMSMQLAPDLPLIQADPAQVQQVVMNLITNASEAMGEKAGTIVFATGVMDCDKASLQRSRVTEKPAPGRFVYLDVADTGCGMDDATLQRLFDPFFSTKITGRGLGMAAVLGIIRGHKGAILVDSQVGRGTTIRVLFPVAWAALAEEGETAPSPSEVTTRAPVQAQLSGTLLIVDDEPSVRDVSNVMVRRLGFNALIANDGQEALAVFREHAASITGVLVDLSMPVMDGVAAAQEMKRLKPETRIILCSGYDAQDAMERFAADGIDAFLQKPYQLRELRETLTRVLKGTE
ncbi:MAG: response regulator, partial [Planctomycetes bacterium]|nr:response regulator [Planctomycetota bacterium]